MPRLLPFSVVSRILGVLLLAAALLKMQGLALDPVSRQGIFSTPEFQMATVEVELLLAGWLLWGVRPLGAWIAALTSFSCFAGASLYLGWIGQSSCGCFGRLALNPWYAFALDVSVVAALFVGRPDLSALRDRSRALKEVASPTAKAVAGVGVFLAFFLGWAYFGFGSTGAALAYVRGERVSVLPKLVDLGTGVAGDLQETTVEVGNWTGHPIRIIGGTSDCACQVTNDLPLAIPPSETRPVTIRMRLPGAPGAFTRRTFFFLDDEGFRVIRFSLTGRIVPGPEEDSQSGGSTTKALP